MRAGSETDGRAQVEGIRATPEVVSAQRRFERRVIQAPGAHSPAMFSQRGRGWHGRGARRRAEPDVENGSVRRIAHSGNPPTTYGQPPVRPARNRTVRNTAGHGSGNSRGGQPGNRQGGGGGGSGSPDRAGGARHVGPRPAWLGRETSGRPRAAFASPQPSVSQRIPTSCAASRQGPACPPREEAIQITATTVTVHPQRVWGGLVLRRPRVSARTKRWTRSVDPR